MGDAAAGAQEAQGCRCRAGEQERPDHLGNHDNGRALPGTGTGGSLRDRALGRYTSWKGQTELTQQAG